MLRAVAAAIICGSLEVDCRGSLGEAASDVAAAARRSVAAKTQWRPQTRHQHHISFGPAYWGRGALALGRDLERSRQRSRVWICGNVLLVPPASQLFSTGSPGGARETRRGAT